MATKMTTVQLEKMLSVAESKIDDLNSTIRKLYEENAVLKLSLKSERTLRKKHYDASLRLGRRYCDEMDKMRKKFKVVETAIASRNKIRDEVDWPSIERMLSQFGFRRDQPVSLKVAIATIVHKLYEVKGTVEALK